MSMEIRAKGVPQLQKELTRLITFVRNGGEKAIWDEIGERAVKHIVERTQQGKSALDQNFKAYTPRYARRKGSSLVNLTVSGQMLGAVAHQAFKGRARIYVKRRRKGKLSNYDLARIHDAGARAGKRHKARIPSRRFMDLSPSGKKKIQAEFKRRFLARIGRLF